MEYGRELTSPPRCRLAVVNELGTASAESVVLDASGDCRSPVPVPPQMETRRLRLRQPSQNDLPELYGIVCSGEVFWRWRYGGAVPSYEAFCSSFAAGVHTQFVVCRRTSMTNPIGLVVAYNADLGNRIAYLEVVMHPREMRNGLSVEASYLFIMYLLKTWDFHKLYLEVIEYNLPQIRTAIRRYLHKEGHFRDHVYYDGRRWDQHVLCLYRDEFLSHRAVVRYGAHLDWEKREKVEPGLTRSP